MSDFKFDLKVTDNSAAVLKALESQTNKALNALADAALLNWDETTRTVDITGRDAVDTGRYVTSQGALTPTGVIQGIPLNAEDKLSGKAPDNTVIIATKVPYSDYLESGTTTRPARKILSRAILDHVDEYKNVVEKVLSGGSQ